MRFWPAILLLFALAALACSQEPPVDSGAITVGGSGGATKAAEGKHDKIWSAVIVATNVSSPKEPPAELHEFAARLKKVFGYNQFEIAGSATEIIDELTENWLVPSPAFPLRVTARHASSKEARGGYLLNLRIFQEKRAVVDTEAKLAPGSPLFIRGPQYGKGQVIIVLQVQH
jgi:hypothetical protein